jgi:hypothetical protein
LTNEKDAFFEADTFISEKQGDKCNSSIDCILDADLAGFSRSLESHDINRVYQLEAKLGDDRSFNAQHIYAATPFSNDKVAIIGNGMEPVRIFQDRLSLELGIEAVIFDAEKHPTGQLGHFWSETDQEWVDLGFDYSNQKECAFAEFKTMTGSVSHSNGEANLNYRAPDYIIEDTKLYSEDSQWLRELIDNGYTIIDIGNPMNRPIGPFYRAELDLMANYSKK